LMRKEKKIETMLGYNDTRYLSSPDDKHWANDVIRQVTKATC